MKAIQTSRAFSLVEVTLALGITAFCLVAIFGLLPIGVNSNQISILQTTAASLSTSVAADLRSTPRATSTLPTPTSPRFGLPLPASGGAGAMHTIFLREDGSIASATGTNVDANADFTQNPAFRATVFFYPPAMTNQRTVTTARVIVSWPASADTNASAAPAKYSGAFETVIALDRN